MTFLFLSSFTWKKYSKFINVNRVSVFQSFLWLNNYYVLWIYCILLISSLIDEHLSCCYILTIMNDASLNIICIQVFVGAFFPLSSLGYILRSVVGPMVTLWLTFWESANLFFRATVPFYSLWALDKHCSFFTLLPVLVVIRVLMISVWVWTVSHFLLANEVEHHFIFSFIDL